MSILTSPLYAVLSGDLTLTGMLATYDSQPAIFMQDLMPEDAGFPCIVSGGEVAAAEYDTKVDKGQELVRDVRCYAEGKGNTKSIEDIANRVWELLHQTNISPAGYDKMLVIAAPPVTLPTDEDIVGRVVSLRWTGMQS